MPGKDVSGVLISVRNDVLKATDGRQVPWEHTSLTGQVYLKVAPAIGTPASLRPPPTMPGSYDREIEALLLEQREGQQVAGASCKAIWIAIRTATSAHLARAMLKELARRRVGAAGRSASRCR